MTIQLQELRTFISDMYSDVARFPRAKFHFPTGRPIMEQLGYDRTLLDRVPDTALESFAGVGHHFGLAPLQPGERVVDLGSGAGSDVFCAARQVGPTGFVTGIEMTDAMLEKSGQNRERFDLDNVIFQRGHIEELPIADGAVDCVISNGVINLVPDKPAVFGHVKRALKRGGRLMFSDIVTGVELPESVRDNCELWAECIGGAEQQQRYVRMIEQAGMKVEAVHTNAAYAFTQDSTIEAANKFKVSSISVLAYKP